MILIEIMVYQRLHGEEIDRLKQDLADMRRITDSYQIALTEKEAAYQECRWCYNKLLLVGAELCFCKLLLSFLIHIFWTRVHKHHLSFRAYKLYTVLSGSTVNWFLW